MFYILISFFKNALDFLKKQLFALREKIAPVCGKAVRTLKLKSPAVRTAVVSFLAVVAILFSFVFAGAHVAYKVNYKGRDIATVKSKQAVDEAVVTLTNMVKDTPAEKAIENPTCTAVLTVSQKSNSAAEVLDAIVENTEDITESATLFVNDVQMVTANPDMLNLFIDQRLKQFRLKDTECETVFAEKTEIKMGYCLKNELANEETVFIAVDNLTVKTTATVTQESDIPFQTVITETKDKPKGQSEVVVAGENGIKESVNTVVYLNGVLSECTPVTETVIKAPVTEEKLVGTYVEKIIPTVNEEAKAYLSNGFVFPVPAGSWKLSSLYGDGRNHKGVDICAPYGTLVMAVNGGEVVYSGWRGGYGYCVEIDHGNGIRTRYGHESSLLVEVGQTVSAGDVIGLVGSTGDSYGNHVHFEVIVGGKNNDPAPYLGLH